MVRRICIASPEGEVGKTITSLNLAMALAELGHRVFLVDLDPQGGIGQSLVPKGGELLGLDDLLFDRIPSVLATLAILATPLPNLTMLPRGLLSPTEVPDFKRELGRPGRLKGFLECAESAGGITILDTPSGMGPVTHAAMGLSDWLLLSFQTESLALRSIAPVFQLLEHIRATENPKLRLLGILPSRVEKEQGSSMDILPADCVGLPGVLDAVIPRHECYPNASQKGLPIAFSGNSSSPEALRFTELAAEVLSVMERGTGKEAARSGVPRSQRSVSARLRESHAELWAVSGPAPARGLPIEGSLSWTLVLERCCTTSYSQAAFLMDLDRRILALAGSMRAQEAQLLAPRLLSALEQLGFADQPMGPCEAISGHLGNCWLTGMSIQVPWSQPLLQGLVGPRVVEVSFKPRFEQFFALVAPPSEPCLEANPRC